MSDSPQELCAPLCSGGAATHLPRKPALRIIVPPTEFCPFSTDLTLPITPLSLPTPVSSSCFTFNDMQELASQGTFVPSTLLPCSRSAVVSELASPTSSQFLLMPPTPRLEDMVNETAVCVSPLTTPAAASMRSGSNGSKPGNPCPWEVSASTWLSDLGGHTETDRIFRHNLLAITSVDTDISPASTPALSPSIVSPSSQVSSSLAYNLANSLARSPALLAPALSLSPTMSPVSSSPARLTLKPTGTDTFPSTLDSLQAWRQSVVPGIPQSEEPCSPLTEDAQGSPLEGPVSETATYPSTPLHQLQSHRLSPSFLRDSKTRAFMRRAKMFGGRVKRLVTRQSVNRHCRSMDRGASFRVVTSQDSEDDSVILIAAPPLPYDIRPATLIPHGSEGAGQARSRTTSEYSSVVQTGMVEVPITGLAESGPRQGSRNRNALRRLSLAALSTIKRF